MISAICEHNYAVGSCPFCLLQQVCDQQVEIARWKKAIEGLTPGGSELVNDPERCAAYLHEHTQYPKQILELRAKVVDLQEALKSIIARCKEGNKQVNWLPIITQIASDALK